jgi:hypothetical protein
MEFKTPKRKPNTGARLTCDEVVKESLQKAEANLIKKCNIAIE